MNGYLNLRQHFDLMCSWLVTIQTAILAIVFIGTSLPATAQIILQQPCETDTPVFTDVPNQTLCEQYIEFSCDTEIGAGTDFPMSSTIGSSLSGNVCIKGTFVVDKDFAFDAATVKIDPGVTIIINSNILLSVDNSKLFACDDLWKGIMLSQLSSIATNNSEIEDAVTAISATGLCGLSIENTIFNRDRIGIELSNYKQGALNWNFIGNTFTCDAPLNGTQNEITYAGVKLTDSYFQSRAKSTFSGIQYGIRAEGNTSYIVARNLEFQNILRDGIHMDKGNLNLRGAKFTNCYDKGIYILTANNVSILGNCNFLWNDSLPLLVPNMQIP